MNLISRVLKSDLVLTIPGKKDNKAVPKVNYWEIRQGDYKVKEYYKQLTDARKLKKGMGNILIGTFIIMTLISSIWISKLISLM